MNPLPICLEDEARVHRLAAASLRAIFHVVLAFINYYKIQSFRSSRTEYLPGQLGSLSDVNTPARGSAAH